MNRPILTVVRGLPGSGKSTYARNLAAKTGAIRATPKNEESENARQNQVPPSPVEGNAGPGQ